MPKALDPPADSFYRNANRRGLPRPYLLGAMKVSVLRAVSSAVEHYVDIVGVTGSIPVPPTIEISGPGIRRSCGETNGAVQRPRQRKGTTMKVRNSLRSLKSRHRDCRIVRRKGRVYVINKTQRRYKARQG